jgi:hypothetical protein
MWEWLATLPLGWQIGLPIIIMVLLVAISIWGNAAVKWGKNRIGFGKHKDSPCAKCRQMVMLLSLKYKTERDILQDSILRDRMNYAEQKVHEADLFLGASYRQMLTKYRKDGEPVDLDAEHQQQILYEETLSNALRKVLTELRRSFKENGFEHMSPVEYTQYCKEKTSTLISIGRKYVKDRYPYEGMVIPLEDRFESLDINQMETFVFNIFDRAREVITDTRKRIKELDEQYDKDMKALEPEK